VMILPDRDPRQIRRPGEATVFTVTVRDADGKVATAGEATVSADNCGKKVLLAATKVDLAKANPFTVAAKMDEPGFLRLHVEVSEGKKTRSETVPYAAEEIRAVTKCPDDFAAYWAGELARLEKTVSIDAKMELHQVPCHYAADYDEYRLSFATFNGKRVHGFMSVPRGAKGPLPLRMTVPGAGPGANFAWDACPDQIILLLNIVTYEQSDDSKVVSARYKELNDWAKTQDGASSYALVGWGEGREAVFFHDMVCGIVRALKWIAARPEVDASHMTYFGGSQGGGCGMAVVGLSGLFSKACFYITALSDLDATPAGLNDGWPTPLGGRKGAALETARAVAPYYDACNFARLIHCPAWVSLGLEDGLCNPPNVQASFNALATKDKRMTYDEDTAHGIRPETLAAVFEWLKRRD